MNHRNLPRAITFLLSLIMILTAVACTNGNKPLATDPAGNTQITTAPSQLQPPPEELFPEHVDPPAVPVGASVYSGTPDTSWYDEAKTEFVLTTADQFAGFQELRSATCTFEGKTVKLGCDVVFNKGTVDRFSQGGEGVHVWKQPDPNWFFRGTFDGQSHIISGLYMCSGPGAERAMLGNVGGNAVVRNFTLINSYFGGPTEQTHGFASVISKVGGANADVTVSNVVSFAIVQGTDHTVNYVGGLIGLLTDGASLSIENCGFHGMIHVNGNYVGGILGYADDKNARISMVGCHNSSDITATRTAGGLAGTCIGHLVTVTDSDSTGTVTAFINDDLCPAFSSLTDPAPGSRPAPEDGSVQFRVMSFNIQKKVQSTLAGKNRMEGVAGEIKFYAPDLLGLQEDVSQWHQYLEGQLSDYACIRDSALSDEACAIYYKKELTLLDSGYGWATSSGKSNGAALTVADVTDPKSQYYMTPEERAHVNITDTSNDNVFRIKMYKYYDDKTGTYKSHSSDYSLATLRRFTYGVFEWEGERVIYVNTHLTQSSQSASYASDAFSKVRTLERIKELEIIQKAIDGVKEKYPDAYVVITGDMNDKVGTATYRAFYELGYESAHMSTLNKYGPDASWNNAFNLDVQGNNYPNTQKEGTSRDFLDYCLVSEGVKTQKFVSGEGKARLADGKTVYTSDHLPIIIDISVKKTG